ncbi:xanthine dehydrogenase family protein molybdopterin-binding subunit [Deinococcus ruber]|uniref:Oxidoreductase n=1 Tax=Deinococcus ruber TaxID=1848197 RepID=A0A918CG04_9DEIO|nr:xanthine dehydrogenase family protein molybdopterin-binding subunit [Deinococcus ruber]GGR19445.1 oxidoreductase [Deinococcus ruber]
MKFSKPAGINPIDNQKVVTRPHVRLDGPLKVSGKATYAYEYRGEEQAAYGYVLSAGIAKGTIESMDLSRAEAAPGVLLVLTHENMPEQGKSETPVPQQQKASPQLSGPDVSFYHQAIAFVVAKSFEQARAAANMIEVKYTPAKGHYELDKQLKAAKPDEDSEDSVVGDFEQAFRAAPVKVDLTFSTPDQSQSPMEPQASLASWDGDQLTVYTSHQVVHWVQAGLAATLKIPKKNVRILSPFVGGGFGSKLLFFADIVLASVASRLLGQPVKTALTRPQYYNATSHRPATIQRVRLAADRNGQLLAVGHDTWSGNLPGGEGEPAADQTKLLYAGEHRLIRTRKTELDLPPGASMRAPGEAVGLLALEGAMDELAEALDLDPVKLRIINDVQHDPEKGPQRPFSSRRLVDTLYVGADRFGWDKRQKQPGQVREGEWLIGMGMASAFRANMVQPSGAKVILQPDGTLAVETQMTDIGTGSYTILGQVAAEMLGLPLEQVTVRLGDSDYPQAAGSGGSFGANSSASGVYAACTALRNSISQRLGFAVASTTFEDGAVKCGDQQVPLTEVAGNDGLSAEDTMTWGDLTEQYAQASFGAHFAEVAVNSVTGETRVRRMLSVVAIGRVMNPVTARSQCLGGITMGIGSALMERLEVDPRYGLFINHDLAEYQVPVHADIPDLDVVFLEDLDDKSSPIKAKGMGELGICGVGAAVANAMYNATGVRLRDFPLTLDKVLMGWADQEQRRGKKGAKEEVSTA